MKKYEFVPGDEITIAPGRTVKRIRALVAIAAFGVSPGDVGGYVETEANLSHVSGDAWVSDNARVYGNAQVYGDAWVSDNAHVSGDAWVSDNARVYGNAQVSGDAWVFGNAHVSGDAWVSGNAHVSGNAFVSGNAHVSGNAFVSGNARHLLIIGPIGSRNAMLTVHADKKVGIRYTTGCFSGSRDDFLAAINSTHGCSPHGNAYAAAVMLADHLIDAP